MTSLTNTKKEQPISVQKQEVIFNKLLSKAENKVCADCNAPRPSWASINFGVFICHNCSGHHRSLGYKITKVQSTQLDNSWTQQQIDILEKVGNQIANNYYEHNIKAMGGKKPNVESSEKDIQNFITDQYIDKLYSPKGFRDPVSDFVNAMRKLHHRSNSHVNLQNNVSDQNKNAHQAQYPNIQQQNKMKQQLMKPSIECEQQIQQQQQWQQQQKAPPQLQQKQDTWDPFSIDLQNAKPQNPPQNSNENKGIQSWDSFGQIDKQAIQEDLLSSWKAFESKPLKVESQLENQPLPVPQYNMQKLNNMQQQLQQQQQQWQPQKLSTPNLNLLPFNNLTQQIDQFQMQNQQVEFNQQCQLNQQIQKPIQIINTHQTRARNIQHFQTCDPKMLTNLIVQNHKMIQEQTLMQKQNIYQTQTQTTNINQNGIQNQINSQKYSSNPFVNLNQNENNNINAQNNSLQFVNSQQTVNTNFKQNISPTLLNFNFDINQQNGQLPTKLDMNQQFTYNQQQGLIPPLQSQQQQQQQQCLNAQYLNSKNPFNI